MNLFIAKGNASQAAYKRLFERVKENDAPDAFHVFLVPDRYTLGVERDLVKNCFPNGYARADVVSFTRFAVKNVKNTAECLSKEGTVVLLRKVLQKTDTRYYKKLFGYGFAKELFAAIASLRTAGITVDDILCEAEKTEGVLGDKLHDIALVEKGYEEEIKGRFSDTVTRIDALEEYLRSADLKKTHFYVLGFSIYSVQQLRILRVLAERAASLNVSALLPVGGESCPGGQLEKLVYDCQKVGIPVVEESVFCPVKSDFDYLRNSIFNPRAQKREGAYDVVLFREEDVYAEIAATAREIKYLVKKDGYRYKDVAVIVNDRAYLPILRATFERCDVPCFIDDGYAFCESLAARFVASLLEAAEYRQESAFYKLARHPYLGFSVDEAENFVKYCKKYGVRYRRFAEPFTLGECEVAERVRKKVASMVERVEKSATAKEYGELLTEMLLSEKARAVTKSMEQSADERDRAVAVVEPLLRFLEEFGALAGEETFGCFEYSSTLFSALSDLRTVLKPDVIDAVFVGNTEESRFEGVKAAFFLGCNEDNFPKKSGDGLIFTAFDNEAMRQKNMTVFPSPIERNALERFVLRDVLSKFSERVYFGCAETAPDGTEQLPGDGMNEIAYWTDKTPVLLKDTHDFSQQEALQYRLVNDKNALYEYLTGDLGEQTEAVGDYLKEKGLLTEIPSEESSFRYPFEKDEDGYVPTSVSKLETYFKCPFKYFMTYGLGIKEEENSTIKVNEIGTIIHNVLESFFRRYADKIDGKKDFSAEIEEVVSAELKKDKYKIYYEDLLSRYIMTSLGNECRRMLPSLIENMRHSRFRPIGFEVAFGYRKGGDMILLNANGETFKVVGKVDRVDAYQKKVSIIDYKTGKVEPSLSAIYYGEKIQLYVYLNHYLSLGYEPAGVFYLPIKGDNVKGGRSYAMVGQLIKDAATYCDFDDRAEEAEEGLFHSENLAVNLKIENNGESRRFSSPNAIEKKTFSSIVEYVRALSEKALAEMTEGYAEKKPHDEKSCEWCPYRRICGPVAERLTPAIRTSKVFIDALQQEGEQKNG